MRILIAFLVLAPASAYAACPGGTATIQSCTLSGGSKVLDVCLSDDTLSYAFGKAGKPADLSLQTHVKTANYVPWNGIGRSYYEEVSFHNRDVTYTVWGSVDRLDQDHPVSGGVEVVQNGETLAHLQCDLNTADFGFDALSQRMSNLGQCWDSDTRIWAVCN